jgi:hypothetical protein
MLLPLSVYPPSDMSQGKLGAAGTVSTGWGAGNGDIAVYSFQGMRKILERIFQF